MAYSIVIPFILSVGSTSAIPANSHAYIWFYFAYCLFLSHYCSSTSFNSFMMLPVKVDLPESTCPMKTRLAFYFLKIYRFVYLSYGHFLLISSPILIVGSEVRVIYSSFFYFVYLITSGCYILLGFSSGFLV